jgi:hypothetical protein
MLLSLVSIEKNIRKKCCHTTRHSLYIYSIHPPVHNAIPRIFIEKTAEFLVVDFFPLLILKWTLRCFAYRFASQYTSRMVPANLCKKKNRKTNTEKIELDIHVLCTQTFPPLFLLKIVWSDKLPPVYTQWNFIRQARDIASLYVIYCLLKKSTIHIYIHKYL